MRYMAINYASIWRQMKQMTSVKSQMDLGTVHLIFWGGGGGGGLGFMSGPENFFRTISEQGYFFAGPSGRIIFFMTESYKYRRFQTTSCFIVVFATIICLIQAFTTNSGLIHAFAEKGYKVYNVSDNDHNQWRTSFLKWRAGNKYNLNKLIIIWRAKRARKFFWILTSQTSR